VLHLVHRRKREIIEKECVGLIEFVEARYDLSAVGGSDSIKQELRRIAQAIQSGERSRIPMGLLFVGPMGTGKTFVANAFVGESGLSAVKLKNIRSKWVGSTEANLEKVLSMVRALGPIMLIIDEGDRAFGGTTDEDGGTSSRVIARLKEFMSDPDNRGRVLTLLMTNRPDKLDVDIKRAGRLDRKIPFFYASAPLEVEAVIQALLGRYGIRGPDRISTRQDGALRASGRTLQRRSRSRLPARPRSRRASRRAGDTGGLRPGDRRLSAPARYPDA
jgi:transitional endoplasmic reticulum ATPase